jgi:hypothetical protein
VHILLPAQQGAGQVEEADLITLGVVLIVLGIIFGIPVLYSIGIVLLVVGLVLVVLGAMGRAVGGRRLYY